MVVVPTSLLRFKVGGSQRPGYDGAYVLWTNYNLEDKVRLRKPCMVRGPNDP